jgi:N-acetylglucosaminyldiphosphoundecaprenol N-acetyl-beta-D-mannosaminyltransferase
MLGFLINVGPGEALVKQMVSDLVEGGSLKYMACANPNALVEGGRDELSQQSLLSADYLIPDGVGILIASWLLGGRIRDRVTGSDVFLGISTELNKRGGCRYFFLGSTDAVLGKIATKLSADFPKITVAGCLAPPFKEEFSPEDDRLMVETINGARADALWVGMTALKQEKWVCRNRSRLNVRFIGAIGAVFDFYAGTKRRSPEWALKTGLEWLPRLLGEPRRLWRRTFVSAPAFLWLVLRERLTRRRVSAAG